MPKAIELSRAVAKHAEGEVVKGKFASLNALPSFPNLGEAFSKALGVEVLVPLYNEYTKVYSRFKQNLQYYYGLEGGWVKRGIDPEPKYLIGSDRASDWGSRLVVTALKISLITNHYKRQFDDLCSVLYYYSSASDVDCRLGEVFTSSPLKIARYTQKERERRDKKEQERRKAYLEKCAREEKDRQMRQGIIYNNPSGIGGVPDEFDEANGAYEFGNSYSYAWYTDRDSYNDVTR